MKYLLATSAGLFGNLLAASTVLADTAVAPLTTTSQVMNLVLSTTVVIALIVVAAWLLKCLNRRPYKGASTLRVVAGTAVGPRERVVVVEIGTTWLVLGVASGNVNALHQMPRVEPTPPPGGAAKPPRDFAPWLARALQALYSKKYQ